ncbi:MAG TPA: SDR family oxidoreductase [Chlamydiales bacterium]|nr:SDR family oxidoreductase [Chlamydiales bacterium]HPE85090.1 SDR family oxidoreductase [Chlamydiales bacterium]
MKDLKGKAFIVTGATRGIGQAIALKLATHGANLLILSKDSNEVVQKTHAQLASFGVKVLILNIDISNIHALKEAVVKSLDQFGRIDGLVNNTSATCFRNALDLLPEQFDLMIATSVRAALFLTQFCVPYLKQSSNPHVINISPPLNMDAHWFKNYLGFSISKYAMSMCTLGMAETFKKDKIAVNSLWPKSTIATQTIKDHFSEKVYLASREPSIMGDAAYQLMLRDSAECTGHFFIDEELLRQDGANDFSRYAIDPNTPLMQALFTPAEVDMLPVSEDLFF